MTVGGLIAALIIYWLVVEVFAWGFRQPEGFINPKPSPVADKPWRSRYWAFLALTGCMICIGIISALVLGFIALVTSGVLNERII